MKKSQFTSRREFIKLSSVGVVSLFFQFSCKDDPAPVLSKVTFGICADVHKDIQPDAEDRLRTFIQKMNGEEVDFIIQLGDFCFPKDKNKDFFEIWTQFMKDRYHVLGNHDMDKSSKDEIRSFLGMERSFYSYDVKDFHFIVLDLNFFRNDQGEVVDYNKGNYFSHPEDARGIIPDEQLAWLEEDINNTDKHTVVFSHQSLLYSSGNGEKVRAILEKADQEASFKKVIACINGHHHNNVYDRIKDIPYININSMSYHWVGEKYVCPDRYPEEIMKAYPEAKYIAPYNDPLYALVELTNKSLKITGIKSDFMPPTPADLGIPEPHDPNRLIAEISDREVRFS